jgi:hypothetical protein
MIINIATTLSLGCFAALIGIALGGAKAFSIRLETITTTCFSHRGKWGEEQVLFERRNARRDAKEQTKTALKLYADLPLGHPDGDHARRLIATNEEKALENYHEALKSYTDLVVGRPTGESKEP